MEKKHNVLLSEKVLEALSYLQGEDGFNTYEYYSATLRKASRLILAGSEDLGMSDHEAMQMLRGLAALSSDLDILAGKSEPAPNPGVRCFDDFDEEDEEDSEEKDAGSLADGNEGDPDTSVESAETPENKEEEPDLPF